MSEFCLYSSQTVLPTGLQRAFVHVRGEKIVGVGPQPPKGIRVEDCDGLVLSPGIVDTHVHLNEPGRTSWEGFETATRAACAGGITSVVDMPLNCIPPTVTARALSEKRAAVHGKAYVDYAFWGGIVSKGHEAVVSLIEAGVCGFKAFLIDSGVQEFPPVAESDLEAVMPVLAKHNMPLLVHAELPGVWGQNASGDRCVSYDSYLKAHPPEQEESAIALLINLVEKTGCAVHIVHLSAARALDRIEGAKEKGLPISVETCPHYLYFEAESIADGATHFKCAPPIRDKRNQDQLWRSLMEERIDCVVSDHSPCLPAMKKIEGGDFSDAWGGIAGLQFSLSVVWTQAKRREISCDRLFRWMSANTAKLAGLRSKGAISQGYDADLFVWDPGEAVSQTRVLHRHGLTPYLNEKLYGVVKRTWVRGECVFNERFYGPNGREVERKRALR